MTKRAFDVNEILEGLDARERNALYSALSFSRSTESATVSPEHAAYWDQVCSALDIPPQRRRSLSAFVKEYGASKLDRKIADIDAYISDACGEFLRKPQRSAVRQQMLRSFVRSLRRRDFEVTPRVVIDAHIDRLAAAIDLAFPGYARAGLLHKISR